MKLHSTLVALGLLAAAPAFAATTLIDFERNWDFGTFVDSYYDGGQDSAGATGPALGVAFTSGALGFSNDPASPSYSNAPSPLGIMSVANADTTLNAAFAFTALSFSYSSAVTFTDAVKVWSGLNGTGTLLTSFTLAANATTGCSDTPFCRFDSLSGAFAGARSVTFGGAVDLATQEAAGIDNISLSPVPEPSTYALMAAGLAILGAAARRRKG